MRELLQYQGVNSLIHSLDPRSKLVWLLLVIILSVLCNNMIQLVLTFLLLVVPFIILSRVPFSRVKSYITVAVVVLLTCLLTQGLFYYELYQENGNPTVIFWIIPPNIDKYVPVLGSFLLWVTAGKGIALCLEGLYLGVNVALRMVIVIIASGILIFSTKPGDIIIALSKFRIPYPVLFTFTTALRFMPTVLEEFSMTYTNLKLRGFKLGIKNFPKFAYLVLSSTIFNSIRRANSLALALEVKCFGASSKRTFRKDLRFKMKDWIFVVICIFLFALVLPGFW